MGSAIFQYVEELYNSLDKSEITKSTYIDYKKTFDTVPRDILLKK